jgi:hypothetical protein
VNDEIERLLERGAVLLEPTGPMLPSEYGKRWMDETWTALERDRDVLLDVAKLAEYDAGMWDEVNQILREEAATSFTKSLTAIANGISQFYMHLVMDHMVGKTSLTMPPTVAMALCTANPASTATGAAQAEAAYTTYGRQTLIGTAFVAATTATPSVTLNASTITFGACTAGGATLLGFTLCDSATIAAGQLIWFGGLTSTVISPTQTPPTVAASALSLSLATSP